ELWADDPAAGARDIDAVMAEMRHIDDSMSTFKPSSEVSKVNALAAKQPVVVSAELFHLLQTSLQYSRITEGAFDITYASVGHLYDFHAHTRPTGVQIDLGGIAKGYSVDRGIEILRARGVKNALVNAGGDSRVIGDRRGRPWMVAIQNPDRPDEIVTRFPLVDEAFSTSGDYERYFVDKGVRYHHILDPRTGDSARKVRSATVIAPTAIRTDGLSKTAFILGPQEALRIYNGLKDVDAILVTPDGHILYTDSLQPGSPPAAAASAVPKYAGPKSAAP